MRIGRKRWLVGAGMVAAAAAMVWVSNSDVPGQWVDAPALATSASTSTTQSLAAAQALPANAHVRFGAWTFDGPDNVSPPAKGLATDSTNGDMYVVSTEGWVYRSTDGGRNWSVVDQFELPKNTQYMKSLQLDRADGTLSFVGMAGGSAMRGGSALLRMVPGQGTILLSDFVSDEALVTPDGVYARFDNNGIFKLTDNGATWTPLLIFAQDGYNTCGHMALAGDTVLLACRTKFDGITQQSNIVLRSVAGAPFAVAFTASDELSAELYGSGDIAVAPSNPDIAYLVYKYQVLRTSDRGLSWVVQLDAMWESTLITESFFAHAEALCKGVAGFNTSQIAVSPSDPNELWMGAMDLYRSIDGGQTFGRAYRADWSKEGPPMVRGLAFSNRVTPRGLVIATDDGLLSLDDTRGAVQMDADIPTCSSLLTAPAPMAWTSVTSGWSGATAFTAADTTFNEEVIATIGDTVDARSRSAGLYFGRTDTRAWTKIDAATPRSI